MDYNHIDGSTCYRNLKNKIRQMMNKIVILGGAESGVGAAVLAKKQGFDVFVSDMGLMPVVRIMSIWLA